MQAPYCGGWMMSIWICSIGLNPALWERIRPKLPIRAATKLLKSLKDLSSSRALTSPVPPAELIGPARWSFIVWLFQNTKSSTTMANRKFWAGKIHIALIAWNIWPSVEALPHDFALFLLAKCLLIGYFVQVRCKACLLTKRDSTIGATGKSWAILNHTALWHGV